MELTNRKEHIQYEVDVNDKGQDNTKFCYLRAITLIVKRFPANQKPLVNKAASPA